jgi:NAD(P)-dependent dehydrogenase (short-subunit alcohol dehydrogenase family)
MSAHLITGATSGMGRAIWNRFRGQGKEVVAVVRSEEAARALGAEDYVVCDLADLAQVERVFTEFSRPLQSLIYCAGLSLPKNVFQATAEDMTRITTVNALSPMMMVGKVGRQLVKGGAIVLFGSQSADKGSFDDAYAASKGAVHSFVKSVSAKLAPDVRIINVSPGITVPSRMITGQMAPELIEQKKQQIPMKAFGEADDVAEIVEFLISPACKFMTGCTIDVNGGLVLR